MSKDISKALKKMEYGVYVVTVGKGNDGNAFTASWLTQVSSEPPMIALSVHNKHQSCPRLKEVGAFAVNMIAKGQEVVAKTYYGPAESGYEKLKSAIIKNAPITGSPLLNGTIGFLDCKIVQNVTTGNHTLFIAEVAAAMIETDAPILTSENGNLKYIG